MTLTKISPREKIIAAVTFGVIAAALIFNFGLGGLFERFSRLDDEINTKTDHLKRYYGIMSESEDLNRLYEDYKEILEKETGPQEVTAAVFKEIENQAKRQGLNIKRIKPLASKDNTGYKSVALELEVEGDFNSIFSFLNKIEDSKSLIKITSARFMPQAQVLKSLSCRVTLSKIYF